MRSRLRNLINMSSPGGVFEIGGAGFAGAPGTETGSILLAADGGGPPLAARPVQPTERKGQEGGGGVQQDVGATQRDQARDGLRQESGHRQYREQDGHPAHVGDGLTSEVGAQAR